VEKENWALSPREEQVWHLWAQGKTNREIAQALQISIGTVKTYLRRLYAKLGVASRAEAARRFGEMSTKGDLTAGKGSFKVKINPMVSPSRPMIFHSGASLCCW